MGVGKQLQARLAGNGRPEYTPPPFQLLGISINSPYVLVARNLRARWVRTVLTVLGILVGVAAIVAVNATNTSTIQAISSFFDEAAGQSDLVVETAVAGDRFAQSTLSAIARLPQVVAAAPSVVGVTVPADEAGQWTEQFAAGGVAVAGTSFWLMGRDPAIDSQVHEYELVDGRLLTPDESAYNILLVDEYAEEKGIEVGEDFAIITPENGITNMRVVGLIAKQGIGVANDGVLGIAPLAVVQELFGAAGEVDQIEVVIEDEIANDADALESVRQQLQARLGSDLSVQPPAAKGEVVAGSIETYQQGLNFFSAVSLFVGSFLIYNAFAMTVVERTREIGMMRAVGTSRRQMLTMVLLEALFLGILGSLIGVWAGMLLARMLIFSASGFTGQAITQVTANPQNLLISFLVGVVVTVGAAFVPALQAARVSPLQALRVQGFSNEQRWVSLGWKFGPLTVTAALLMLYYVPFRADIVFYIGSGAIVLLLLGATLCIPLFVPVVERGIRPLIILIFGNEGRLGSSNVNRAKGRTTLTVAALMVGISMAVGINGLTASFEADLERWIETALGGDLFVRSPMMMKPDVESRLLALDGVTAVTRSRAVSTRLITQNGEDEFAFFIAIDPATFLDVRGFRVQEGPSEEEIIARMAEGGALVISSDSANRYGIEVGDTVWLETKRGKQPFEIAAIVLDFSGGEILNVTGSWGDLRQYFGIRDVENYALTLAPGASLEAVTQQIEQVVGAGSQLTVESKSEFADKIRAVSREAFTLFDVLVLIGLVVAALGVINTMLMNVMERTREIGGLRSLGMSRRQVQRMILAEAATIGVIGSLFGMFFGAVLTDVFLIGLQQMGSFVIEGQLPLSAMAFSFFAGLLVALVAAWYPGVRASRVNIIEAIKHE